MDGRLLFSRTKWKQKTMSNDDNTDPIDLAFALVRHPEHMEQSWMLQRQHSNAPLAILTAERLEGESFRTSLDRELAWALRLRQGKNYLISKMARLNIEDDFHLPGMDKPQACRFAFLVVDFYGRQSKKRALEMTDVVWATGPELHAGRTESGELIAPWQVSVIQRTEVVPNHASSGH